MKTANLIINWLLSDATCYRTEKPSSASPFDQIWRQGDKNLDFQTFQWLAKIWKCNLGFSKIPIFHLFYKLGKTWKYTQPQTNISKSQCWIYGWVGKTYVLIEALLLKIRWRIHIKEDDGISNLNERDIPFPKILRICQWIGKNIFHWKKWNEPIKLIREYVRLKIKILMLVAAKRLWGHSKSMFTQNFKFSICFLLFIPFHFTCSMIMNFFEWKIEE